MFPSDDFQLILLFLIVLLSCLGIKKIGSGMKHAVFGQLKYGDAEEMLQIMFYRGEKRACRPEKDTCL